MLLAKLAETTSTFKIGAFLTHVLALIVIVDGTRNFKKYMSPDNSLLSVNNFGTHPFLMLISFGLFAPIGAISWRVYHDYMGLRKTTVKRLHMVCTSAAIFLGFLGIWDMWAVHSGPGKSHFQSAHAWLGLLVYIAFTWQWLGGLIVMDQGMSFDNPYVSAVTMVKSKGMHALMGSFSIFGGLIAIITGILSYAGRGDNVAEKDVAFKWLSIYVTLFAAAVGLVFAGPKPGTALSADEQGSSGPITTTIEEGGQKTFLTYMPGAANIHVSTGGAGGGGAALAPAAPAGGAKPAGGGLAAPSTANLKQYTREEVAKHTKLDDIWVILNVLPGGPHVYDITKFLPDHPGGEKAPLLLAGKDATQEWLMLHKPELLAKHGGPYLIGTVSN
jgi:cytochrome b-561